MRVEIDSRGRVLTSPVERLQAYAVLVVLQPVGWRCKPRNENITDVVAVSFTDPVSTPRPERIADLAIRKLKEIWEVDEHGPFRDWKPIEVKIIDVCDDWILCRNGADQQEVVAVPECV